MPVTVLYTCGFVPAEWIAAHGLAARKIVPRVGQSSPLLPESGTCPSARSYASAVLSAGKEVAAVFTTRCDQMRRLAEMVSLQSSVPVFILNVPATCRTCAAQQLYSAELRRLSRWLQEIGGCAPDVELLVNAAGRAGAIPGRQGAHAVDSSHPDPRLLRLGVTGGPWPADCSPGAQVEAAGARLVLDVTETGLLGRPQRLDPLALREHPVGELVRAYLAIPSVHQRPNLATFERLKAEVRRHNLDGLILRRYVWCDLWHAEAARIADQIDVPLLDLEVEGDSPAQQSRTATRIEGFVEMLKASGQSQMESACSLQ